jgi:hypothetical protein
MVLEASGEAARFRSSQAVALVASVSTLAA